MWACVKEGELLLQRTREKASESATVMFWLGSLVFMPLSCAVAGTGGWACGSWGQSRLTRSFQCGKGDGHRNTLMTNRPPSAPLSLPLPHLLLLGSSPSSTVVTAPRVLHGSREYLPFGYLSKTLDPFLFLGKSSILKYSIEEGRLVNKINPFLSRRWILSLD